MKKYILHLLILALLFFAASCNTTPGKGTLASDTFRDLAMIRDKKQQEVKQYFDEVRSKAKNAEHDDKILSLFAEMKNIHSIPISDSSISKNRILEYEVDLHYVTEYSDFYDLLFVDSNGFVFHSVKQESDYHKNLFQGELAELPLSKKMRDTPGEFFLDYHYYPPSDEAASFFVIPVKTGDKAQGWVVLQSAINKVNTILTDHKGLGRTGEVYLVNREKKMLTDSRFLEDSTILKQKVDTEAVRLALDRSSGEKVIKDYRGVWVFSAFQHFDIFGSPWVIIVEIDEDEVISEHYRKNKSYYMPKILETFSRSGGGQNVLQRKISSSLGAKRIDVGEFGLAKEGEKLKTVGVGPCTSIIASRRGDFGYMAHIAPVDDIYGLNLISRYVLGDRKTGFLENILKRIKTYHIFPYQLRELQLVVVANHTKSLEHVVESLLDEGINLSQIKFIHNRRAEYANVLFDQSENSVLVEWQSLDALTPLASQGDEDVEALDSVVKKLAAYRRI